MEITSVKIWMCKSPPPTAIATIIIDDAIAINDIKVYLKEESNNIKIQFPNHPTTKAHGKHNIVPLNDEVRLQIQNAILEEIKNKKE